MGAESMENLQARVRELDAEGLSARAIGERLRIGKHRSLTLVKNTRLATLQTRAAGTNGVSLFDAACQALAQAKSLGEVKATADKMAGFREYARRCKGGRGLMLDAQEIIFRAERKSGEILVAMHKAGEIASARDRGHKGAAGNPGVTLQQLEIDRHFSSRVQKLAALPEKMFEGRIKLWRRAIEAGELKASTVDLMRPGMVKARGAGRNEGSSSLDFYPTPPWATRALIEIIAEDEPLGRVWEPACGEGHMAEVLKERALAVYASDVHDYGHGYVVLDFFEATEAGEDWIITNPPFSGSNDRALAFAQHALGLKPKRGVALLVSLQWLEGVERWSLFVTTPPSTIAIFAERVNLVEGRWDPDGSKPMAYAWLIWDRRDVVVGRTDTVWIPPGSRERLTKPDDRARFAAWSLKRATD